MILPQANLAPGCQALAVLSIRWVTPPFPWGAGWRSGEGAKSVHCNSRQLQQAGKGEEAGTVCAAHIRMLGLLFPSPLPRALGAILSSWGYFKQDGNSSSPCHPSPRPASHPMSKHSTQLNTGQPLAPAQRIQPKLGHHSLSLSLQNESGRLP